MLGRMLILEAGKNQKERLNRLEQAMRKSSELPSFEREKPLSIMPTEPDSTLTISGSTPSEDQNWALDPVFNTVVDDTFSTPSLPETGLTALHRAICSGNEAITRILVERGASLTRQDGFGLTALHLAVDKGYKNVLKILLEHIADPNVTDAMGRTALFQAVQCEDKLAAMILLEGSVDVNWKDSLGNTALHLAVERGSEGMTLFLLEHRADIDA